MEDEKEESKEIAIQQDELSPLVTAAMNSDMDLAKLDKLIEVQERFDKNQAKKEFYKAFSRFKQNPLIITKDSTVDFTNKSGGKTTYDHASLGNIMSIVGPLLSAEGLALSWIPVQNEKGICVTAVLSHTLGFSIDATLHAPPDPTGGKGSLQALGSTITYLERYTGVALLGLAMTNDDDGQNSTEQPQYENEASATASLMNTETLAELEKLCLKYQADYQGKLTGWDIPVWNRIREQMKANKERLAPKNKDPEESEEPGKPPKKPDF